MALNLQTEGIHNIEFVVSEANGSRSREERVLETGQAAILAAGTLLKAGTGTKLTEWIGTTTAVTAILAYETDAVSADAKCTVIIRDAEVNKSELVYEPSGTPTGGEKIIADADLTALGVIVRTAI